MRIAVHSIADMQRFARQIARSLKGGEILLLQGPLGSGKTTFVKALAKALGVKKTVVSPTFTLCHQYSCQLSAVSCQLIHIDCYRLKTPKEFLHLGALERMGEPDSITVIEWPEKIKKFLPRTGRIVLRFSYGKGEGERVVYCGSPPWRG